MSSPYPQQGYAQQPMMNNTTVINNSPAQGKVCNQSWLAMAIPWKNPSGYPERMILENQDFPGLFDLAQS